MLRSCKDAWALSILNRFKPDEDNPLHAKPSTDLMSIDAVGSQSTYGAATHKSFKECQLSGTGDTNEDMWKGV